MSGEAHQDEYHDAMVDMLELIWGEGFLAPGGAELVKDTVGDFDISGKRVLDIGCGIGGGDIVLARDLGAEVVGIDLEPPLIDRARRYVEAAGLEDRISFKIVEAGPLAFPDESFDVVYSSGAFTQIDDKAGGFAEVHRVLRPDGIFVVYDWMRGPDPYSDDMRYWFELEGLTYAMETLERHGELLREAGFLRVELEDDGGWYRQRCAEELEELKGPLRAKLVELLGEDQAQHFIEDWRAMLVVLEKRELRPGRYRAVKAG